MKDQYKKILRIAGKRTWIHSSILRMSLVISAISYSLFAQADVDFRTLSSFDSSSQRVDYNLSVSDCHLVESMSISAGSYSDTQVAIFDADNTCNIAFTAEGAGYLNPSVTLQLRSGQQQIFTEAFILEAELPKVAFNNVSFSSVEGRQFITVNIDAIDNVDISYIGFSITGLRASDLRSSGGVIEAARESAFVQSAGVQRVYPSVNDQNQYSISLPVTNQLSAEEIASNGLILYDIFAVDASFNSSSISGISFTGEDVTENVLGVSVAPLSVIISNVLEVVALIPSIDFEFRGVTPRPGSGQGFSYTSSNPAIVQVSDAGLIFPVAETNGTVVDITISYPGQADLVVPVTVDFNKTLDHLEFAGVTNGIVNLPSLNKYHQLPALIGVFTDGDTQELSATIPVTYIVNDALNAIIDINVSGEIKSKAIIESNAPALVTVALTDNSTIQGSVNITVDDALPVIKFRLPSTVEVNTDLFLAAEVSDDVGIRDVRFFLDEALLAIKKDSPYKLTLPVGKELLNRTLKIRAEVYDSAGQQGSTDIFSVGVITDKKVELPELTVETPTSLQRFVENSKISFLLSRKIEDIQLYDNSIKYLEFFLDRKLLGASKSPRIVSEKVIVNGKKKDQFFENWLFKSMMPTISVRETTVIATILVHGQYDELTEIEGIPLRVIENRPPQISIIRPVLGQNASVGQQLEVETEFTDDTLASGTQINLFVENVLVDEFKVSSN